MRGENAETLIMATLLPNVFKHDQHAVIFFLAVKGQKSVDIGRFGQNKSLCYIVFIQFNEQTEYSDEDTAVCLNLA